MIEERAVVIATHDGDMIIEVQQQSACGGCNARSTCGTTLLAALFKQHKSRLRVDNSVAARPGDHVVVGIDEATMVSGSMRLYLLPLLGLIGGAILAQAVISPAEASAIAGGLAGMALVLWLLHRRSETARIQVLRREPGVAVALPARGNRRAVADD